jgi:demethylmenaquinone methyltransferase/2-methoxy-6-polyprenyl-1,4-benzoquinol methylase
LAREIRQQSEGTLVVAADFTPEMVKLGKGRTPDPGIQWLIADAQHLPFKDEAFSAVVSGYLLRNLPDVDRALSEQNRVSRTNGRIASLDTTPPDNNWLRPLIELYLNRIIPLLGRLVGGAGFAYQYLSRSTQEFLTADQLADKIQKSGFRDVKYRKLMFRTMAIHLGRKTSLS